MWCRTAADAAQHGYPPRIHGSKVETELYVLYFVVTRHLLWHPGLISSVVAAVWGSQIVSVVERTCVRCWLTLASVLRLTPLHARCSMLVLFV